MKFNVISYSLITRKPGTGSYPAFAKLLVTIYGDYIMLAHDLYHSRVEYLGILPVERLIF